MDRQSRYQSAAIDVRERNASQVRTKTGKQAQRTVLRLFKLVQQVPNWETYLTDKQAEAIKVYQANHDFEKCDEILKLTKGGTYSRIFGDRYKQHHAAIGRLENAYKKLVEAGTIKG